MRGMNLQDLNDGDLTAWQRECILAYEELFKAGICLPAKNGAAEAVEGEASVVSAGATASGIREIEGGDRAT